MAQDDRIARNDYLREYMAKRYQARRSEAIARLGGRCVHCGSAESDEFEFDHIDRSTKTATLANLMVAARDRFERELVKCQLLCRPCHVMKTAAEIGVAHGAGAKGKRHCPCDLCRDARSAYARRRRRASTGPNRQPVKCGTASAYRRGCRCAECRNAHRIRQAEWRQKARPR